MHTMWMIYDHRQALVAIHVFLFALAFTIHFTLLSTDRYNWMDGADGGAAAAGSAENTALPPY